ncbi:class I SAM-dependent methyltransferase [Patescibacteria group bacterium]|nr:class I SAM-dependent methyltransferase [Patescibacteria group bacterium]
METQKVTSCLSCGGTSFKQIADLGKIPLPNGLVDPKHLTPHDKKYPLGIQMCNSCNLIQLTHIVAPDEMFDDYFYIPSTSVTMLRHFKEMAQSIVAKYKVNPGELVIDIGSNDGTLLSYFMQEGTNVLGVDPADNIVSEANSKGIRSVVRYFSQEVAHELKRTYGSATVITGTNVFAHIPNINDVLAGVRHCLHDDGIFVSEFAYGVELLRGIEFDTIYHEHVFYHTVTALIPLFERAGLTIVDVERYPIHGGSLRVFANKSGKGQKKRRIAKFIEAERSFLTPQLFASFQPKIAEIKKATVNYLREQSLKGRSVIGYGAPAKATVFLNFCGIGKDLIPIIVDSIPYKQGKLVPGVRIPIVSEERFLEIGADVSLIFPWNFVSEIVKKNSEYCEAGGKFVVAIPKLTVI